MKLAPLIAALFVSACSESGGELAKLSDADLQQKRAECAKIKSPSKTKFMACENYARECKRRLDAGTGYC